MVGPSRYTLGGSLRCWESLIPSTHLSHSGVGDGSWWAGRNLYLEADQDGDPVGFKTVVWDNVASGMFMVVWTLNNANKVQCAWNRLTIKLWVGVNDSRKYGTPGVSGGLDCTGIGSAHFPVVSSASQNFRVNFGSTPGQTAGFT